jgi:hypothetical protein
MDWLNIFLRIATVIGGTFFVILSLLGAYYLWTLSIAFFEIWRARARWMVFRKQNAEFQAFARYYDPHNNTNDDKQSTKNPKVG